jgi:exodeoxyribonuclease V gamma subunit
VAVLREAILHRLAQDPTLEPRDVIVMCPDIEAFAPLIEASFGAVDADDAGGERVDLRVRLADRSLRQTNPVLGVVARLLELPEGRMTASEVLDLADRGPIRQRFAFDDDDLAQIREWVAAAGIHWGLDADHRAAYKLAEIDHGTWSFGLRRLLLGVTMSESGDALFGRVLPVDDVQSGRIELAGTLAELIDRIDWSLRALTGPQTISGWTRALAMAADLLSSTPEQDSWQRRELDRILADVVEEASLVSDAPELTLPEIRAVLGDRLAGRPTRANFRTGHLTICTLMPMRSVPHRVVCLLGLDDGSFPRQSVRDGDDLLLRDPQPGDRDPRKEDRQLLLDAVVAASDAVIITYTGKDERTNAPRPPAVPVGELLDAIDATAYWRDGERVCPARERIRIAHPLQPFDPDNFVAGRLAGASPWSFDGVSLEGTRAFLAPRQPAPPFLGEELPPLESASSALALRDLIAFVEHPVRAFLRQRLGISMGEFDDEVADGLPVELRGLGAWGLGQRLLDGTLAGAELRDVALAEIARGTLPPGELGRPALQAAWHQVQALARVAAVYGGSAEPRSVETNILLSDGTRVTGTVSGVREHVALTVGYSRLAARHRLAAWVRLLALSAAHPELPFEAVTVGRSRQSDAPVVVARISALGGTAAVRAGVALAELERIVELYRAGMRRPLALASQTTFAYAEATRVGADPVTAALGAWRTEWRGDSRNYGEDEDPEHQRVFDGELLLDDLATFAASLWGPLAERETVETP